MMTFLRKMMTLFWKMMHLLNKWCTCHH